MSEDFNAHGEGISNNSVSLEEVSNRSIHLSDSLIEVIRENAKLLSKSEVRLLKRLETGDVSFSELVFFLQGFLVRLKALHKISEIYVLRYDSTWELSYGKYPEDGYGLVDVEEYGTGLSSTGVEGSGGFLAPLLNSSLITSLSDFIGIGVKPTLVLFSTVAVTLLLISGTLVSSLYGSKMNNSGGNSSVVVSSGSSSSSVSKSKSSSKSSSASNPTTSSSSSSSLSSSSSSSFSSSSSEVSSSSSEEGVPSPTSSDATTTVASAEISTAVTGVADSASSVSAVGTNDTASVDTSSASTGGGSRGTFSSSTVSISGELPVPSTGTGTVDTGSTDVPVEVPPADTGSEVPVDISEDTSTSSTTTNGSSE